jgi:hypothetical protein
MEAFSCYNSSSCNQSGLTLPIHAYPHESGNNSITGGYVYRGSAVPSLMGKYVYADYVSGRIWALSKTQSGYANELLVDTAFNVASFGVDADGELLICGFDSKIHRLRATSTSTEGSSGPMGMLLEPAYPNPASETVRLPINLSHAAWTRVVVHDALGRKVANVLDARMPTGHHVVSWSGHNDRGARMPAGLYWIRVSTDVQGTRSAAVIYLPS